MKENRPDFTDYVRSPGALVSIIIPCFGQGHWLPESVGSAASQDYPDVEIIIVNDGSPDNTKETAEYLMGLHGGKTIRLIEKANGGVSDARNAGLRASAGRVVMCLDADDLIAPNYVSTGLELLRTSGAKLFHSNQENFGDESGPYDPPPYSEYAIRYTNCITNPALYDRELFEVSGGYKVSLNFGEDWEYWINLSRYGLTVCKSEERLYRYRVTSGGLAGTLLRGRPKDVSSILAIINEDLYPVEEVLVAHEHVPHISAAALDLFRSLSEKHRNEWLTAFLKGLLAEAAGGRSEAMRHYWLALDLTQQRNWQPFFRLALIFENAGQIEESVRFYRQVHTLRPDMSRFVLPRIVAMGKAS